MSAADVLADLPAYLRELIIADVEQRIPHDPPPSPKSVDAVGHLVRRFAAIHSDTSRGAA